MEREQAKAILSQDLAYRQKHEAISFFVPHKGQEDFISLLSEDGAFIVLSGAGNGWGKSELLAAIFAGVMWPALASPAFGATIFQDWPHPKRARIYSTPAELEEIGSLQTAIKHYFPTGRYTASKGGYRYPSVIRTDTGWTLDLFSYERSAAEAAGPNIGLQAFNEPPPEALWKEGVARARAGGLIIGGMTSLLENVWFVGGVLERQDGKAVRVRYGNSCENCIQHGSHGHLEHDKIEAILSQYDPDEREARFSGKPLSFSGRIFKSFDRRVHVAKEEVSPPAGGYSIYQVVDPAIGKPLAVIWAYADGKTVSIYDEYPNEPMQGARDSALTVEDYIEIFRTKEAGKKVSNRILDRHYGFKRQKLGAGEGNSLAAEFEEKSAIAHYPVDFEPSYQLDGNEPEVETGIAKMKDYLRYDKKKEITALNRPKLLISPNCINTIQALERWSRDPKTAKPREEYKDFADCVRYLVMSEPTHDDTVVWADRRKPHFGVNT